jgi:hypothetical protein
MKHLLLASAFLLVAAPAYAGCANYVDGSLSQPGPEATICFKGDCETTTIILECEDTASAAVRFANGWMFQRGDGGEEAIYRPVEVSGDEFDQITCRMADGGACPVVSIASD